MRRGGNDDRGGFMNRDRDNNDGRNDGVGYISRGGGHRGDYNRVSVAQHFG